MRAAALQLKVLSSIDELPAQAWNELVGARAVPFLRWEWFHAMEASRSATAETGWEPHHLTLWRGATLVGLAPAYRKHHSMGEYIYDFSWAHAAEALGVRYYPKLLIGAPLSPITAQRFHAAPGEDLAAVRERLVEGALQAARAGGCSSVHVIFPTEEEAAALERTGLTRRTGMQYHWRNPGYRTYDEYLARFDAKRRHQIKRERGAAAQQGIDITTLRGDALSSAHARLAHRLYASTCAKNGWGAVQLTQSFFERVFDTLRDSVEMVVATREGEVIAGAFNLATPERLFGRYWGAFEEQPFLHFHVCLYHSIDDCIRAGRQVFEPGAGGEHKVPRGFEPTAVHSAHRLFDARLERAVKDFVLRERSHLREFIENSEEVAGMRPFSPGAT